MVFRLRVGTHCVPCDISAVAARFGRPFALQQELERRGLDEDVASRGFLGPAHPSLPPPAIPGR